MLEKREASVVKTNSALEIVKVGQWHDKVSLLFENIEWHSTLRFISSWLSSSRCQQPTLRSTDWRILLFGQNPFFFALSRARNLNSFCHCGRWKRGPEGELCVLSYWPVLALSDLSPPEPSPVVEFRYFLQLAVDFNGWTNFKVNIVVAKHKLEVLSFSAQGPFSSLFEYELNFVCPTMILCSTFCASHSPIYIHFKWIHSCKMFHVA